MIDLSKENDNDNVSTQVDNVSTQVDDKYPTDKTYHAYFSTKYYDRIKNTEHCRTKNALKGVICLPLDVTIVGFNIMGVIAMNICYIFG